MRRRREGKGATYTVAPPWLQAPELPDTIRHVLTAERETLGTYVSGHPIEHLQVQAPQSAQFVNAKGVDDSYVTQAGAWVQLAGVLVDVEARATRRGGQMATFGLECLDGVVRCLMFGDNCAQVGNGWVVRLRGVIEDRDDRILKVTEMTFVERW